MLIVRIADRSVGADSGAGTNRVFRDGNGGGNGGRLSYVPRRDDGDSACICFSYRNRDRRDPRGSAGKGESKGRDERLCESIRPGECFGALWQQQSHTGSHSDAGTYASSGSNTGPDATSNSGTSSYTYASTGPDARAYTRANSGTYASTGLYVRC